MCLSGMLMGFGRVLVRLRGVCVCFLVVARLVVRGGFVMVFSCFLVMLGCFVVSFDCHVEILYWECPDSIETHGDCDRRPVSTNIHSLYIGR